MDLYKHELMDHYRYPRNQGTLDNPSFATETLNPSCGDKISLQGIVLDGILKQIKFQGAGCVISQAAASMLTEKSSGQLISVIETWNKDTMIALLHISLGPTRLRCALLCLEALHSGIASLSSTSE